MIENNNTYKKYFNYDKIFIAKHDNVIFPSRIYNKITSQIKGDVLDIGTGDGYKLKIILDGSPKTKIKSITALDPSPLVKQAEEMLCSYNVCIRQNDWLDFVKNNKAKYDVILCFEVLEHLERPDLFLEEIVKLLKPEGIFISSTPNRPVYRLSCYVLNEKPDPTHVSEMNLFQVKQLMKHFFSYIEYLGFFPYLKAYQKFTWFNIIDRFFPFLRWTRTIYCFAKLNVSLR